MQEEMHRRRRRSCTGAVAQEAKKEGAGDGEQPMGQLQLGECTRAGSAARTQRMDARTLSGTASARACAKGNA